MSEFSKESIKKVLNFWYCMDFFNQEDLPNESRGRNKKGHRYFRVEPADSGTCLDELVNADPGVKGKDGWSAGYAYIGRIPRDLTVRYLASILQTKDNDELDAWEIEKTPGHIAAALIVFGNDGELYDREKSYYLKLSPIIWATAMASEAKSKEATLSPEVLDGDKLEECEKAIFNNLLKKQPPGNKLSLDGILEAIGANGDAETGVIGKAISALQEFARASDSDEPWDGEEELKRLTVEVVTENPFASLSTSFYAQDIKAVAKAIDECRDLNELDEESWLAPIARYVLANGNAEQRIEMLSRNPKEDATAIEAISRILSAKNTPLGRWPSGYHPAFMQQCAVNLAVGRQLQESMLSVNGPPGTGKTTLLKDVIAACIVERAAKLAQYETPDDALVESPYEKRQEGYCKDSPVCFKLKDDSLNDLSILICSTNNTAVENISIELPLWNALFESINLENTAFAEERKLLDVNDLYFAEAASVQFPTLEGATKERDLLLSARLGKKDNVKGFREALKSVFRAIPTAEEGIPPETLQGYRNAREAFLSQKEKVSDYLELFALEEEILAETKGLRELMGIEAASTAGAWDTLKRARSDAKSDRNNLVSKLNEAQKAFNGAATHFNDAASEAQEAADRAGAIPRLFFRKRGEAKEEQLEKEGIRDRAKQSLDEAERGLGEASRNLDNFMEEKPWLDALDGLASKIERHKKIAENLGLIQDEYDDEPIRRKAFVRKETIGELAAEDSEKRKAAHLSNPVHDEILDRERDKLFILALKMQKSFVLASPRMRANLENLYAIWGGTVTSVGGDERKFNRRDRDQQLPNLMQSLFLLTPVISSTFASINKRKVFPSIGKGQESAPFGLLVVDEAGQAVPYAALGALARCRRSIIVGDPRQIPPVVTPELNVLRRAWQREVDSYFTNAARSAQNLADRQNPYGSGSGDEWVGCPLLIHRRCTSPMFDIANMVSYSGRMMNETGPLKPEQAALLTLPASRWINVSGCAESARDHYVKAQGERALALIEKAFINARGSGGSPNLFVISPFNTVIEGLKHERRPESVGKKEWEAFRENNLGTVHKFQGKEADEVIFVLGCDYRGKGAVKFVSPNIVNVAASRAKKRFCAIGDFAIWKENPSVREMKDILDEDWHKDFEELRRARKSEAANDARTIAALERKVLFAVPTDDTLSRFGLNLEDLGLGIDDDKWEFTRNYIDDIKGSFTRGESTGKTDKLGVRPADGLLKHFGFATEGQYNEFIETLKTALPEDCPESGSSSDADDAKRFNADDIATMITSGVMKFGEVMKLSLEAEGAEKMPDQEDLAARDCLYRFSLAAELVLRLHYVKQIRKINQEFLPGKNPTIGAIAEEIKRYASYLGGLTYPEPSSDWWDGFSSNARRFAKEHRNPVMHSDRKLDYAVCRTSIEKLFPLGKTNSTAIFCTTGIPKRLAQLAKNEHERDEVHQRAKEAQDKFNEDADKGDRLYPEVIKPMGDVQEKKELLERKLEMAVGVEERRSLKLQIENEEKGANGEHETAFVLEHSSRPIYIMQDLFFKQGGDYAQIDILAITPGKTFVIECKNYSANVRIEEGTFYRETHEGEKIPFFSPLKQNERHIDVMIRILNENQESEGFDETTLESLVVFANKAADIIERDSSTGESVRNESERVVRIDNLLDTIQRIDKDCSKHSKISETRKAEMKARAAFWLKQHKGKSGLGETATTWLQSYDSDREAISDPAREPRRVPLRESDLEESSDKSYRTISEVVKEWPISAPDANDILVREGYIYVPDKKELNGKECNYGLTNLGQDKLGLALRERSTFYCPVYPIGAEYDAKLKAIILGESEKASPTDT